MNMLEAPIPGQSLTELPRNAPYERPAEYDTVEDTLSYYMKKVVEEETIDDIAVLFQVGMDLRSFCKTLVMTGAMNGLHTVETGMLAAPMLGTFLKSVLLDYGIEAKETATDPAAESAEREKQRVSLLIQQAVAEALEDDAAEDDTGVALLQDIEAAMDEAPQNNPVIDEDEVAAEEEPSGNGLMSRKENL